MPKVTIRVLRPHTLPPWPPSLEQGTVSEVSLMARPGHAPKALILIRFENGRFTVVDVGARVLEAVHEAIQKTKAAFPGPINLESTQETQP